MPGHAIVIVRSDGTRLRVEPDGSDLEALCRQAIGLADTLNEASHRHAGGVSLRSVDILDEEGRLTISIGLMPPVTSPGEAVPRPQSR